ncbi:hypothetical protein [Streptomyces sp. S.PB5]|uniref:hypothetical protein n=1 Tax=Streptomyces sp. S.PB5 TaxID=3020844 RepID=UPI0025B06572|nr:hypothetical protein [Streptomyces sp. S.PB5]MDN3021563.1 hypothetical protein [Streptomyces sp. S.PB5]
MSGQLVVLALKVPDVRLGDITDHAGGRLQVREIVQRRHLWDLAGDPPGHVHHDEHGRRDWRAPDEIQPTARRSLPKTDTVRVWRTLEAIGPVRGHGRRIERTDLVARGWFRFYSSHTAGCSCGWREESTHTGGATGAGLAEAAWLDHKATALTRASYVAQPALGLVTELQDANTSLAPVPWTFGPVYNGPAAGGGIARGSLDGLPLEDARTAMTGWAAALGADEVREFRYPARQGLRGWKPPRVELSLSAYGSDRALVELAALIEEPASADESADRPGATPDEVAQ